MKRLDETRRDGRAFADWLRKELLAIGDATERTKRLTRRELGAYVLTNGDFDGRAGGEEVSFIGGFRLAPGVNGNEPVATLAEIEADLFDGESPLAVVCDANGAVLVAASVWRSGIALHKGDYCTILPAANVREELRKAKGENA